MGSEDPVVGEGHVGSEGPVVGEGHVGSEGPVVGEGHIQFVSQVVCLSCASLSCVISLSSEYKSVVLLV